MTDTTIHQQITGDNNIVVGQGNIIINYPSPEKQSDPHLIILRDRVKRFWIDGVLNRSVYRETLLELGKETNVDIVDRPWKLELQLPDQTTQSLSPSKKVFDIFNELNRTLLILGEPGSGKTTTLLELARDLISESEENPTSPIPVVFNLSTWKNKIHSLLDWLIIELSIQYKIPKKIGRVWLEEHRILPLLDGLDEVKPESQADCVVAINIFGEVYGLSGLVVCSRYADYVNLNQRLSLNGAIILQHLTSGQIDDFFANTGTQLEGLRSLLKKDKQLSELARSPLMLNVMSLAYEDISEEELSYAEIDGLELRRNHLFNSYIARMFERRKVTKEFTSLQVVKYLTWLASRMKSLNKSIFLIEQIQPNWLSTQSEYRNYVFLSRVLSSLLLSLILAVAAGINPFGPFNVVFSIIVGLLLAFLYLVKFKSQTLNWNDQQTLLPKIGYFTLIGFVVWIIYGLPALFPSGTPSEMQINPVVNFIANLFNFFTPLYGLIFALMFGLRFNWQNPSLDIQVVETLTWSWKNAVRRSAGGFVIGLILGVGGMSITIAILGVGMDMAGHTFTAINGQVFTGREIAIIGSILIGTLFGIFGSLIGSLAGFIFGGLHRGVKTFKTASNTGLRLSLRNAIYAGTIFSILPVLISAIASPLIELLNWVTAQDEQTLARVIFQVFYEHSFNLLIIRLIVDLIISLIVVTVWGVLKTYLSYGILAGLWYGGFDLLQHFILRCILVYKGYIPKKFVSFLDQSVERVFLQRVGGGYMFIHSLLRDHFASMYDENNKAL